jgi:hypothetical protein
MADNDRRFVADASEMGIGVGPDHDMRFIAMSLLSKLREDGMSDAQIHARLPRDGRTVFAEADLGPAELSHSNPTIGPAEWAKVLKALETD